MTRSGHNLDQYADELQQRAGRPRPRTRQCSAVLSSQVRLTGSTVAAVRRPAPLID
jgi:hypothetical protein